MKGRFTHTHRTLCESEHRYIGKVSTAKKYQCLPVNCQKLGKSMERSFSRRNQYNQYLDFRLQASNKQMFVVKSSLPVLLCYDRPEKLICLAWPQLTGRFLAKSCPNYPSERFTAGPSSQWHLHHDFLFRTQFLTPAVSFLLLGPRPLSET